MDIYGDLIRMASAADLEAVTALEAACFPPAEAAGRESMQWRLATYPTHFWVAERDGRIVSMVNGPVTIERDLADPMYDSPDYHNEQKGEWQMIFGVATHPSCQRQGLAGRLLRRVVDQARAEGRRGVVLTCKVAKIAFYEQFGFSDEGLSASVHGGVPWHQMRLTL